MSSGAPKPAKPAPAKDKDEKEDEEKGKPVTALDAADIALLKTYGAGPYSASIKKLEADILEEMKKVNELIGEGCRRRRLGDWLAVVCRHDTPARQGVPTSSLVPALRLDAQLHAPASVLPAGNDAVTAAAPSDSHRVPSSARPSPLPPRSRRCCHYSDHHNACVRVCACVLGVQASRSRRPAWRRLASGT